MISAMLARGTGPLRVLLLGAHSDDIEIGCGGTVLELRRLTRPVEFRWAVFSAIGTRADEARGGAKAFLGSAATEAVRLPGFRDGYFPSQFEAIKESFELIGRSFKPDLVFTHAREDRHQDHRVMSDLAWNTFRQSLILEYEIPKWDGDLGRPNSYIPLRRSVMARKSKLLMQSFATQRNKDWFDERTFEGLARLRGVECRAPDGFAEAFYARKLLLGL
jgi:LmbE family N-acetylglucosaminyl deacetylase